MPVNYLHNHGNFADLLRIVGEERRIAPVLVEKDYWIMHCLHGLQQMGLKFELKGGTSLSKGFGLINRFTCPGLGRTHWSILIHPTIERRNAFI